MIDYVAGFLFDDSKNSVVLIKKQRPDWQKGKYNAIGGHVLQVATGNGETTLNAMIREYEEETGLLYEKWENFLILTCPGKWRVYFYRAFGPMNMLLHVRTKTDEEVGVFDVQDILEEHSLCIANLRWIIPLALDCDLYVPIDIEDKTLPGEGRTQVGVDLAAPGVISSSSASTIKVERLEPGGSLCEPVDTGFKDHHVKTHSKYFIRFAHKETNVTLRKDDRGYREGDTFTQHEWDTEREFYTGCYIPAKISKILRDFPGLVPGYCLMTLAIPDTNIVKRCTENTGKKEIVHV